LKIHKPLSALCRIPCWLALAGSLLWLAGCSGKSADDAASAENTALVTVTLTKVQRADMTRTLAISGAIAALPNEDAKISSQVAGRIASMNVAEGDAVEKGAVLARIENQTLKDQIQQAEAALAQAKASLQNALLARDRTKNLFQRGIAAGKEVEDANTQVTVQQGAVQQAEAALSQARTQLGRAEIRSPLTGTVVKRFVSVGEQMDGSASQPIFEVANLQVVELQGNVAADYLAKIHLEQKFTLHDEAFPGHDFSAVVAAVSPAVDPVSGTGMVRIRVENRERLLRMGMFLTAQLPLETHARALCVPPQAIYKDGQGQPHVYRVQGSAAESVPVTPGIESSLCVEILSGVQEGDSIILSGGYGLADHAKVKVAQ
jgi:RND family efflux transporter MFP subunit